jgi:hypothetical protein
VSLLQVEVVSAIAAAIGLESCPVYKKRQKTRAGIIAWAGRRGNGSRPFEAAASRSAVSLSGVRSMELSAIKEE